MAGTNLFAPDTAAVHIALTDESGNAILVKCATGDIPSSASGYAIGCMLVNTTTGTLYTNTGTASSCTFTAVNTDTAGNIALATGSMIIGAAGVGSAIDVKTAGNILVGNGSTATSVNLASITVPVKTAVTLLSATPGNVKGLWGMQTTAATMTSGTIIGTRGEVDIPNSGNLGGGAANYAYGTQGKIAAGTGTTIDCGSGHVAGILGQLDISGATTTSGHIAPVISSIQDSAGIARTTVNGFYAELPAYGSGALMNSVLQGVGAANYGLDLGGIGGMTKFVTLPSSVVGAANGGGSDVYIDININGVPARITAKYVS